MLDIGVVRERTGLTAATLRHYEDQGLIEPVARTGLRRQYNEDVLRRLAVITLCKRSGFSLAEMRELFDRSDPSAWRAQVVARIERIDELIRELSEVRVGLAHAQDCPSEDIMMCDHFNQLVDEVWGQREAHTLG